MDRELLPIKAHYFLFNAATGPMMHFLPTIAEQLGLTEDQVGNIFSILPISGVIAKPLFGSLADKFRLHKTFFIAFQIIIAIAFFTINFIPEDKPSAETVFICDGVSFIKLCSNKFYFSDDDIKKVTDKNTSCHLSCKIELSNLCKSWNLVEYCTLPKEVNKIEFEAQFQESYGVVDKNCLQIRVFSALFPDGHVHETVCNTNSLRIRCRVSSLKSSYLDKLIKEIQEPNENVSLWFLEASLVSWIGMAVVVIIADAVCFDLLGDAKYKDYGKQSMWGSIAFGLLAMSSGYLIDYFSKGSAKKNYSCLFYLMLICMIFDILVSTRLQKKNLGKNEPSVFYELCSILREGRVLVFAWWCIGAGMCTAVVWNFISLYIQRIATPDDDEWIKTLQGLIAGVQCFLGQLPFNFISGNILQKVGHINVMSIVLLAYAIRFMAYSLISNIWMVLLIELLHGPSFGLCWPTMVSYGDKVAPSGMKATIQGLIGAVFEGIGVASGSFIFGHLMHKYDGKITMRIFSTGALVWLTSYWILQIILQKVKAYPLQQGHTRT